MSDVMLYVMVATIIGMFGWAAFEYATAGYEWWREQHGATSKETGIESPQLDDHLAVDQTASNQADSQDSVDAA